MKKSSSDADLTKRRSNRVRIGSVDLDDIGLEMSISFGMQAEKDSKIADDDILADIDPFNQRMLYRHFFKKIYNHYFGLS